MRLVLQIISSIGIVLLLKAQDPRDSLESLYRQSNIPDRQRAEVASELALYLYKNDTLRANQLFNESIELAFKIDSLEEAIISYTYWGKAKRRKHEYQSSVLKYKKAIELAEDSRYLNALANAYQGAGLSYYFNANYDSATKYALLAEQLRKQDTTKASKVALASIYNNLGIIQERLGNYFGATEYHFKSLREKELVNNRFGVAITYNNLGNVHQLQGSFQEAVQFYLKAIEIKEEIGNKGSLAISRNNLGSTYLDLKDFDKAECNHRIALNLSLEISDDSKIALSQLNLGSLFLERNELDSAKYYFLRSKAQPNLRPSYASIISIALGRIEMLNENYTEAIELLEDGVSSAMSIGEVEHVAEGSQYLAKCYSEIGNYESAYNSQRLYTSINDSIQSEGTIRRITSLNLNYLFEKEKDSISFVERERRLSLENELIESESIQNITFTLLFVFLVLILFSIFFYRSIKKRNNALRSLNAEVQAQNAKIKSTNEQLRRTQERLLQSEKIASIGSLASGIGHELNNPLNFIHGSLELLNLQLANGIKPEDQEYVRELTSYMETGVKRAASVVGSLTSLARNGKEVKQECKIEDLIQEAISFIEDSTDKKVSMETDFSSEIPPFLAVSTQLYQMFFNLILNAVQAVDPNGKVSIFLEYRDGKILTEIIDNGKGISKENLRRVMNPFFTTKAPNFGTGLGLTMAIKVANDHGGTVKISSEVDEGTVVIVELPTE